MRRAVVVVLGLVLAATPSCVRRAKAPTDAKRPGCGCRAHAPKKLKRSSLCGEWVAAVDHEAEWRSHVTFPETDPRSCFVRVRYEKDVPKAEPTPSSCGYPSPTSEIEPESRTFAALEREALRYEAIANGAGSELPFDLSCELPKEERVRAAKINATTLRATARRAKEARWPYAAIATFGYGSKDQLKTPLPGWRPGQACPSLTTIELGRLQPNVTRAGRAADAWKAGIAPAVIVSGGAVHAEIYEAWLLDYLLTCRLGVPADAVLVDPCAQHTHTNVRNTGGLVVALGGRAAYVVTDSLQANYLQDWTTIDLFGGGIDQRSLRDWGYLLGSWRQASVGARFGFWLTPFRFWAEPEDELGGATCVR
ncbi:MAG: YdcF family protein [Deltaproteobacteria bacterium]|nr:YdcF family protein [Deltaproteobacteria bacterium]